MILKVNIFTFILIMYFTTSTILAQTWPIENRNSPEWITSCFGSRDVKEGEVYDYDFHRGIDIGADVGTPVRAVRGGKVIYRDPGRTGENQHIYIEDLNTDIVYKYFHISPSVEVNDVVDEGDPIGTIHAHPGGPHVDFKYYPDGDYNERSAAKNPLKDLDYDEPTGGGHSIYIFPNVEEDGNGNKYIKVKCLSDNEAPDFEAIELRLNGKDANEFFYTDMNLLKGDLIYNNTVNYHDRINCGDINGDNTDVGKVYNSVGELSIEIIPSDYSRIGPPHELDFRFYVNEDNWNLLTCASAEVSLWDVVTERMSAEEILVNGGDCSDWEPPAILNPVLTTGITSNQTLEGIGESDMYSIHVNYDAIGLRTVMKSVDNNFDIYGKYGTEPTSTDYTWAGQETGIEENVYHHNATTGNWNIMVLSQSGPGPYTLTSYNVYRTPDNGVRTSKWAGWGDDHIWQMEVGENAASMNLKIDYPDETISVSSCTIYGNYGTEPTPYDRIFTKIANPFKLGSYSWNTTSPDIGLWYLHLNIGGDISNNYYITWEVIYNPINKGSIQLGEQIGDNILMGQYHIWQIEITDYSNSLSTILNSGSNDFDIYGKYGSAPTTTNYDWIGNLEGGEDVTYHSPQPGTWYIMVHAKSGSGNYYLTSTLSSDFNSVKNDLSLEGVLEIDETLTVSSDANLTINPGTILKLGQNVSINVLSGSSIIANGEEGQLISFERLNSNEPWDKIKIEGNSYVHTSTFDWSLIDGGKYNVYVVGQDVRLNNCTIKNAVNYGIYVTSGSYGGSNLEFTKCRIDDNNKGVYASEGLVNFDDCLIQNNSSYGLIANGADLWIDNSTIKNNGMYGIILFSSDARIFNSTVEFNESGGINVNCFARLFLGYGYLEGYNRISDNENHEIKLYSESRLYAGRKWGIRQEGYNRITDDINGYGLTEKYIYNASITTYGEDNTNYPAYAEYNRWYSSGGSSEPNSDMFYGTVEWNNYLSWDPSSGAGSSLGEDDPIPKIISESVPPVKTVLTGNSIKKTTENQPTKEQAQLLVDINTQLIDLREKIKESINTDRIAYYLRQYHTLLYYDPNDQLKERQYYDELCSEFIKQCQNDARAKGLLNVNLNVRFAGETAMMLKIGDAIIEKDYPLAIDKINEYEPFIVIDDNKQNVYFAKMLIYMEKGNYEEALKMLEIVKSFKADPELKLGYTSPDFTMIEETISEEYIKESGKKGVDGVFELNEPIDESLSKWRMEQIPTKFALSQNFPNPFNPSTKIKFALPKASTVKIEVYNTLGQRVETLLNQHIVEGHHVVEFNAQNLSSGIYYYRILAGEFQGVKKMILLK